jgi:hypothetical protein
MSQDSTPELVSGRNAYVFGDVSLAPGDISPPPTVYYETSLYNLFNFLQEYDVSESVMTGRFDDKGDIHREIVSDVPQPNTSVHWKYCKPSRLHMTFLIQALTM